MLFTVKRLRDKDQDQHGPDRLTDWFAVQAPGNPELIRSGESPAFALPTAFSSRTEANRLVSMLNAAYDRFHREEEGLPPVAAGVVCRCGEEGVKTCPAHGRIHPYPTVR